MSLNIIIDADVTQASQAISKFSYEIKKSFGSINTVVDKTATGFQYGVNKMAESTKSFAKASQNSLTALSLTLQDLPFGFIGIQNNLPGIVQGFGQMSAAAKTGASVMSQLKGALMGPAGIFLAFSAVTAIVTTLTMKYGGLGNAIDALFGKTNLLSVAQGEYNKELAKGIGESATESAEITILTKVLTDLSKPLKDRQAAYVELNKISPAVVAGIKLENISTAESVRIINENAKAIQKLLILKAQEAAISNILTSNAEKLATLQIEEKKLQKDLTTGEAAYNKVKKEGEVIIGAGRTASQQAIIAINSTKKSINENRKEQEKLNKVAESYINLLDPTIKGIAEIDLQTRKLTDSTKKQKTEKFTPFSDIGDEGEAVDAAMSIDQINKLILANLRLAYGKNGSFTVVLNKLLEDRKRTINKKLKEEAAILVPKKVDKNAGPINKNPLIEYQFGQITAIIDALKQEAKFIDDAFRAPLENLFIDFLQKGKLSFEDFTKSVVKNIGQIVAKLAASKIFEALANLIPQIAGTLLPGGSQLLQVTKFLGTGRSIFGAANLSGLDGGGMNLNGQVVFVQRGTDLVGVMNRTNSQISRIG